jgi:hypothetical protein
VQALITARRSPDSGAASRGARAPDRIVELAAAERLDASDVVAGWSPLVRELLE